MHRSIRIIHSTAALGAACLCALLTSCGSDSPSSPGESCDPQSAAGFSISNPERGHVYVWGGTGQRRR